MIRQFTCAGPTILIIEQTQEGFFLYQFRNGSFVGDTSHATVADAKEQATHMFGKNSLPIWTSIPDNVTDLADFARNNSN